MRPERCGIWCQHMADLRFVLRCRRKTDAQMCNDEHAQQEQPSQPPSKRRRSSRSGPHTEQSDPVPGKKKRGRPPKTTSAEQPHKNRKPGWGKWQEHSDMYVAKPKPKSISTWRQLTMNQGTSEKDDKQAADSDDIWDTEGSTSDDGESEFDPQTHPVHKEQSPSVDQQHAHPQNGAQKHKTSKREHAGTDYLFIANQFVAVSAVLIAWPPTRLNQCSDVQTTSLFTR